MARYPDAQWVAGGDGGVYVEGPWRVVLHTTEGGSAAGAIGAYRQHNSWPHFTVDADRVYQHVDTGVAARSLKNAAGGVQTNRLRAVQIEIVGYAAKPKGAATLEQLRRLLRWIEAAHGVPQRFPAGPPLWPAANRRPVDIWRTQGGYYGHQHVPENDHVDPGALSAADLGFTAAEEDDLTPEQSAKLDRILALVDEELEPWLDQVTKKTEAQGLDLGAIKADVAAIKKQLGV